MPTTSPTTPLVPAISDNTLTTADFAAAARRPVAQGVHA